MQPARFGLPLSANAPNLREVLLKWYAKVSACYYKA